MTTHILYILSTKRRNLNLKLIVFHDLKLSQIEFILLQIFTLLIVIIFV